ncbi:MAG: hypothetical protein U5R31_08685 [Acidimicrobiia bacterium]|nr:hypothetical protein [Acidimicrobiia bacterium]
MPSARAAASAVDAGPEAEVEVAWHALDAEEVRRRGLRVQFAESGCSAGGAPPAVSSDTGRTPSRRTTRPRRWSSWPVSSPAP